MNIQLEYIDKFFCHVFFCKDCNLMVKVDRLDVEQITDEQVLYCGECYRRRYGIELEKQGQI